MDRRPAASTQHLTSWQLARGAGAAADEYRRGVARHVIEHCQQLVRWGLRQIEIDGCGLEVEAAPVIRGGFVMRRSHAPDGPRPARDVKRLRAGSGRRVTALVDGPQLLSGG